MSKEVLSILSLVTLIIIGIGIRFRIFKINPAVGVDQWYWFLCAEDVKKRRRLPPKLPYFMLEIQEQWYPPLYAGLLALLPMKVLERHGGKLSHLIDLLHGVFIFLFVLWISGSTLIAFLSGLSYSLAFFPVSYNYQLQPRGLANLLLTVMMMGLWFYLDTGNGKVWGALLILSVALLFLHKMTAQLYVVYLLGIGLWAWNGEVLLLLPASVLLAIIVSKGFYVKMLRAHWDIVSFWNENIHFLESHQYYESPIYKTGNSKPTDMHARRWKRLFNRLMFIPYYNIFVPLLFPAFIDGAVPSFQDPLASFLWVWLALTYFWAISTTVLPFFKALGAGALYIYQSFFPMFLLIGLYLPAVSASLQKWLYGLWAAGIVISLVQWKRYCKSILTSKTAAIGEELREVLDYLRELPKDGVFCIPFRLSDGVAYWTRKKVFWGGHSYGFHKLLKPYFPIMRESVEQTLKREPLSYLLFWRSYLESLKDIGLEEGRDIHYLFGKGEYELFEIIK